MVFLFLIEGCPARTGCNCQEWGWTSSAGLGFFVTTQPQLIRNPHRGEKTCSFSPHDCHMGGRAFGPPLCRGCAPATPPYKTISHRPCLLFPSIVSGERSLLPHSPPQPTDLQPQKLLTPDPWPLTPAVPRPRNAPLQNHLSPTGFILPQHRVWRTESTPPLAASTHRPPTSNRRSY